MNLLNYIILESSSIVVLVSLNGKNQDNSLGQQYPKLEASLSCLTPAPPKIQIHIMVYITGTVKVPLINCLIVLPFEILAVNIPIRIKIVGKTL